MTIRRRRTVSLPLAALALALGACTVFQRHQNIRVETVPAGADVYLDGELVGQTPMQLSLPTTKHRAVYLKKADYRPELVVLELRSEPDRIDFYQPPDIAVELVPLPPQSAQQRELEIEIAE